MKTKTASRSRYSDRFIPLRESNQNAKQFHNYGPLVQKTEDLIAEALAADPSLATGLEPETNAERLSQMALTQHRRTSFLIEKILPKSRKLLRFGKRPLREKHLGFNENKMAKLWKQKKKYKLKKSPVKILEAPGLLDDYYLNLVVWGQSNIIGVGLEDCVYFYIFNKNKVVKHFDCSQLDDFGSNYGADSWPYVCSMSFNSPGNSLAVADSTGRLTLTDVHTNKRISSSLVHSARIGSLHWQNNLLVSGSRDSCVNLYDTRKDLKNPVHSFIGHHQEICGLKLSPDNKFIVSGGNDNECLLWSLKTMKVRDIAISMVLNILQCL